MGDCDRQYRELLRALLDRGEVVTTRNAEVRRLFGLRMEFRATPLVSLRRTAWRNALREWEWFMSGSNDIADLHPSVRPWWQPWADEHGQVPYNYSHQFRSSGYSMAFDQIAHLVYGVTHHPYSRRNCLTTWNPEEMAAPTCPITNCHHSFTQAFVDTSDALHLVTYQRSADVMCGLSHNLIQAWAFLLWLAHRAGRGVGSLVWFGGDVHLYETHRELARRVADAEPRLRAPELVYQPSGDDFRADDFSLSSAYEPAVEERARMVV